MIDIGERNPPPVEPPDRRMTFAEKVTRGNAGGRLIPEELFGEAFVAEKCRLEFPEGEEGEAVVTIGDEVLRVMNTLWQRKRLREMWMPKGAMYVIDLPRRFFMVRFELEEEYLAALTGGPWRVFGSILMVQAWTPEFDPLVDEIVTTPVWIRLTNIPVNLYHKDILFLIARGLGNPLKVDLTTLNFERARFARICVEVNLAKPLKGTIRINGGRYFVSYEGLTNICSRCGLYGHPVHACPRGINDKETAANARDVQGGSEVVVKGGDGFTPVRRQGRKAPSSSKQDLVEANNVGQEREINLNEAPSVKESAQIPISNSFGMLEDQNMSTESRPVACVTGDNKENEYPVKFSSKEKHMGHVRMGPRRETGEKGPLSNKEAGKNRKARVFKTGETTGPKYTQLKPTRGLVFGPTRGEVELSASGKRMRVESIMVGRAGGIVLSGRNEESSVPLREM
ncbi:hypothetical protein CARUB_v10028438mg, partial [Capsella rubella]